MKRWDYSYYSNRIEFQLLSESGPFAQNKTIRRPFFHHKYYKKGENKIAGTRLMEQKFGSADFSGFLFTTAQHAYLLRIFTEVWQQILSNHKGRKGKSGQAGNFISPYS